MTTSQANSAADILVEQIRELLAVGYRPERVATKLGIPLADVLAAKGIPGEGDSPDLEEAVRRTLLLACKIAREEALEAWEVSKEQGEETITTSGPAEGPPEKITTKVRKHSGDVRYLDRVTRIAALEARLRLGKLPPMGNGSAKAKPAEVVKTKQDLEFLNIRRFSSS